MSDDKQRRKELLESLKSVATKEKEKKKLGLIHSNMGGDRIYKNWASIELINKDFTKYTGKINKRATTCVDPKGFNFRSYVYETTDGRWFDRAGLPISKPSNLVTHDKSEEGPTEETA